MTAALAPPASRNAPCPCGSGRRYKDCHGALAATAMHAGSQCLAVTLGSRGAVYFASEGFESLADLRRPHALVAGGVTGPIRTELIPAEQVTGPQDPTGCGDVWGATYFSRLLAGDKLDTAIDRALDAAARNFDHRGATGLADYLRGELSIK